MIVSKTNLALTSEHQLQETMLSLAKYWQEEPPTTASFRRTLKDRLQLVPAELLKTQGTQAEQAAAGTADDSLQAIIEMLLGLPHAPGQSSGMTGDPSTPRRISGGTMQLMEVSQTTETESCSFAASGNICLADGSTRQFDVGYQMERSEQSTQADVAQLKDPLVVDFGAPESGVAKQSVAFDIDSDGKAENLRLPTGNSGILFDDRNHNGITDDGSELFGPQTGNGFGELTQLDSDGNGWIDGGDAAYADLKLWQVAKDGSSSVRSLAEAGIGALSTASAATPFTLKEHGETVGQVRASGVWLGEHSGAGIVRQIDVGVTPEDTQSS